MRNTGLTTTEYTYFGLGALLLRFNSTAYLPLQLKFPSLTLLRLCSRAVRPGLLNFILDHESEYYSTFLTVWNLKLGGIIKMISSWYRTPRTITDLALWSMCRILHSDNPNNVKIHPCWKNWFCTLVHSFCTLWANLQNKLWKILKEMGILDHLTYLLRNLYAGQ